jgi:hypothetical protein
MALTADDKHLADFEKGTEGASCPGTDTYPSI